MNVYRLFLISLSFFSFLNSMDHKSFTLDSYGNAIFDTTKNKIPFSDLQHEISNLLKNGHKRAIWIKTNIADQFSEKLSTINFDPDHVEKDKTSNRKYLLWLRKNGIEMPPFGNTNVGAGGIIIRHGTQGEEVLLTRIKYREKAGWEVPGGCINFNEMPEAGAIREVEEETGLQAQVQYLIAQEWRTQCYRKIKNNLHLYFIMHLDQSCSGKTIKKQENEVKETYWLPLNTITQDKKNENPKLRTAVFFALKKYLGHQLESLVTFLDYRQQGKSKSKQNPRDTMQIYLFDKPPA